MEHRRPIMRRVNKNPTQSKSTRGRLSDAALLPRNKLLDGESKYSGLERLLYYRNSRERMGQECPRQRSYEEKWHGSPLEFFGQRERCLLAPQVHIEKRTVDALALDDAQPNVEMRNWS